MHEVPHAYIVQIKVCIKNDGCHTSSEYHWSDFFVWNDIVDNFDHSSIEAETF